MEKILTNIRRKKTENNPEVLDCNWTCLIGVREYEFMVCVCTIHTHTDRYKISHKFMYVHIYICAHIHIDFQVQHLLREPKGNVLN